MLTKERERDLEGKDGDALAYRRVATILKTVGFEVTSVEQLDRLKHIGTKTKKIIHVSAAKMKT